MVDDVHIISVTICTANDQSGKWRMVGANRADNSRTVLQQTPDGLMANQIGEKTKELSTDRRAAESIC